MLVVRLLRSVRFRWESEVFLGQIWISLRFSDASPAPFSVRVVYSRPPRWSSGNPLLPLALALDFDAHFDAHRGDALI